MYNQRARRYNERLYRRARFALEDFYGASMTPCYTQKNAPKNYSTLHASFYSIINEVLIAEWLSVQTRHNLSQPFTKRSNAFCCKFSHRCLHRH